MGTKQHTQSGEQTEVNGLLLGVQRTEDVSAESSHGLRDQNRDPD